MRGFAIQKCAKAADSDLIHKAKAVAVNKLSNGAARSV